MEVTSYSSGFAIFQSGLAGTSLTHGGKVQSPVASFGTHLVERTMSPFPYQDFRINLMRGHPGKQS